MDFADTQAGILTNAWLLSRAGCGQVLEPWAYPERSAARKSRLARAPLRRRDGRLVVALDRPGGGGARHERPQRERQGPRELMGPGPPPARQRARIRDRELRVRPWPRPPSRTGWCQRSGWGLSLWNQDLLAARVVHRLPGRVALRSRVVRPLVAVTGAEVTGECRRRRDGKRGHCQDRCKRLAPHTSLLSGEFAQSQGLEAARLRVMTTSRRSRRNLPVSQTKYLANCDFLALSLRATPHTGSATWRLPLPCLAHTLGGEVRNNVCVRAAAEAVPRGATHAGDGPRTG